MGPGCDPEPPPAIYFIGNIILCAGPNDRYEIYDGLQRFTTLTILIAVLRDLIEDRTIQAELDHLVASKGTFRLHLFGRDRTLAEHVQAPHATRIKADNRAHYEIGRRILRVKNACARRSRSGTSRAEPLRALSARVGICCACTMCAMSGSRARCSSPPICTASS